ncbi:hypothetical protein [Pontivivens insulae]|uniref:Uncharacterized protein n=1 Tax=Pontivivens insulae TaxID=1639689 RepID=A0A2R8AEH2_9RHOB|nr:hypothetical protein [Pontivivens insulae]RED14368.1 hypothetical protein DFR53_1727 [Pontivivens insulae]SPF30445.1 hypothetical protein POI8812_02783 [Pontivivens insulae]
MLLRIINHFQPRWLLIAGTAYVVLLLLSHWQLPEAHVWAIAGVFSVIMNVPYVATAWHNAQFARLETAIATVLIGASIVGAVITPPFVIAAIFAHGFWDIAKHRGAGVPFFSWYTLGCAVVDFAYGSALLVYYLS